MLDIFFFFSDSVQIFIKGGGLIRVGAGVATAIFFLTVHHVPPLEFLVVLDAQQDVYAVGWNYIASGLAGAHGRLAPQVIVLRISFGAAVEALHGVW